MTPDDVSQSEAGPNAQFDNRSAYWWEGGKKVESRPEFSTRKLDTPLDKLTRKTSGRRSQTHTDRKRGRYIQARPAGKRRDDIAFDATLRAAAPFQRDRALERVDRNIAYSIHVSDLHRKIRVKRAANLILFVVDASWSMAVEERMQATKGAILSLLTDAYQRRDRVGLVIFQKNQALTILSPTNSITLARQALADIPVGGKTPLSAGLELALSIFKQEAHTHPDVMPLMILLTDGAGNVSIGNLPPLEEANRMADAIRLAGIRNVTINMEHAAFDQGLARQLSERLGGPCYSISQLHAQILYETVKDELK